MNKKKDYDFSSKPRALMCYICGREYGTSSLNIHIKQCMKRFEEEQAKKPKKDRKPLPKAPETFDTIPKMNRAEMDQYNSEAFDKYNTEALAPCPNCGRTFLEDSLVIHLRSCKPKDTNDMKARNPVAKVGTPNKTGSTKARAAATMSGRKSADMAGKGANPAELGYKVRGQEDSGLKSATLGKPTPGVWTGGFNKGSQEGGVESLSRGGISGASASSTNLKGTRSPRNTGSSIVNSGADSISKSPRMTGKGASLGQDSGSADGCKAYCSECGRKVDASLSKSQPGSFCTGCGSTSRPGDKFCSMCGTKRD